MRSERYFCATLCSENWHVQLFRASVHILHHSMISDKMGSQTVYDHLHSLRGTVMSTLYSSCDAIRALSWYDHSRLPQFALESATLECPRIVRVFPTCFTDGFARVTKTNLKTYVSCLCMLRGVRSFSSLIRSWSKKKCEMHLESDWMTAATSGQLERVKLGSPQALHSPARVSPMASLTTLSTVTTTGNGHCRGDRERIKVFHGSQDLHAPKTKINRACLKRLKKRQAVQLEMNQALLRSL